jgi:hypothetical protein
MFLTESDNEIAPLRNKVFNDNDNTRRNSSSNNDGNEIWKRNPDLVTAGTSNSIIREIVRYVNLGVNYFTIHFADLPDIRSLDLFAKHVIPHFR